MSGPFRRTRSRGIITSDYRRLPTSQDRPTEPITVRTPTEIVAEIDALAAAMDRIDYIALDDTSAAEKVYRALIASAEQLTNFPEMGRSGHLPGTREFSVSFLPRLIVYKAGAGVVTILAVFHSARDLARALIERKSRLKQ